MKTPHSHRAVPRLQAFGLPRVLLAVVLLAVFPSGASAHHSFAMYDTAKVVTLTGTVKEFQWTNPHALIWLYNDAAPGASPDLWSIELPTSPGPLSRMGWNKHSLTGGDRVVMDINPLRDGQHGGSFKKAKLERTGETLVASAKDEPDGGAPGALEDDAATGRSAAGGSASPPTKSSSDGPSKRRGCAVGRGPGPRTGSRDVALISGMLALYALLARRRARHSVLAAAQPRLRTRGVYDSGRRR